MKLKDIIVKRIKEHRLRANLSQKSLADKLGVSLRTITNWERSEKFPGLDAVEKLCDELGVDVAEFFAEEQKEDTEGLTSKHKQAINKIKKIDDDLDIEYVLAGLKFIEMKNKLKG